IRTDELDASGAAERAIERVEALSRALEIPSGLHDIGVDPADFDTFARHALGDAYIATNPRPVSEDDVRRICIAAYGASRRPAGARSPDRWPGAEAELL